MSWWRFGRTESRASSSFTDLLLQAASNRATGTTTATAAATGALEACAGALGRAFAAADVKAPSHAQAALTPDVLNLIGRSLIRSGEVLFLLDVVEGGIVLQPVSDWDVQGSYDPVTWAYRASLAGPSSTVTRAAVPAASVLHLRYAFEARRPWQGVGPLQFAHLAGRLSAETAAALADEASGPRGAVLPIPVDGDDPTVKALKNDIRTLSGNVALVESQARGWAGDGQATRPMSDWRPQRIGADPPAALVSQEERASMEVYAACGVPPALFAIGEGTAQRESYRRFLHGTVAPLARIVAAELSAKLDGDVVLNFDSLFAADLSGRARAFQSLVSGGMAPDRAAGLAGLMTAE